MEIIVGVYSITAMAKALFINESFYVDVEWKAELERGVCPRNWAAFYAYSREHREAENIDAFVMGEIVRATLGCYDVSHYYVTNKNSERLDVISLNVSKITVASRGEGGIEFIKHDKWRVINDV